MSPIISIRKTKKYISLLIILSLTLLFSGCSINNPFGRITNYTSSKTFFDTIISITVYDDSKEHADILLANCEDMCEYYENIFDANITSSDIYKINNSNGNATTVSPDTIVLLEKSQYYSNLSDGLFDPTIYAVSSLWDFHNIDNPLPLDSDINEAITHVNYKNINVDVNNNTVTLSDPKSCIDIGGIAKGYIADKLYEYLQNESVTGAIINIGGDISVLGSKPNNEPFTIGIYNPITNSTNIGANITDKAIATSGTYERKIVHNGITYHHILSPHTGSSAKTDLESATIITKMAIDADALCTIAILIGSDATIKLVDSLPDTECILIKDNGDIIYSQNAKHLLSS